MTLSIILAFSAFLLSLLGTRLYILAFRRRAFPLEPSLARKRPVPHNGGLVLVMAMIICLLAADIPYGVILGIFLITAVSLLDDVLRVPFFVKLLVYVLAVIITLEVSQHLLFAGLLPPAWDRVITVLLWVWFIQACNAMDGADGMMPIQMISIGIGLLAVYIANENFPDTVSPYNLILAAAGWGFLWWNWYPAKVHLGEVGSAPIGFFLGYLLYNAATSGYPYAALILPAYYVTDVLATQVKRIAQSKAPFQPHADYIYLTAVRKGRKHDAVARYVFGVNMLLILLAVLSVTEKELAPFLLALAYLCASFLLVFFAYQKPNPAQEPF